MKKHTMGFPQGRRAKATLLLRLANLFFAKRKKTLKNFKQSKSELVNNSNNKATLVPCVFVFELLTQGAEATLLSIWIARQRRTSRCVP